MKFGLSGARKSAIGVVAVLALGLVGVTGAGAAEYFIPKGHLYGPGTGQLPPPESRRAQLEAETDILETELYREEREDRLFYERFRDFIDRDLLTPGDVNGHYSYY